MYILESVILGVRMWRNWKVKTRAETYFMLQNVAEHTLNLKRSLQIGNCKVKEAIQKTLQIGPNSDKSESGLLKFCNLR